MATQTSPNIHAERIKGHLDLDAATTGSSSLRIRPGTNVSVPNAGDIWNNGTDIVVGGGEGFTILGNLTLNKIADGLIFSMFNSQVTGTERITIGQNAMYGGLWYHNSGYGSTFTGTSISLNNTLQLFNGTNIGTNPLVINASVNYNIIGSTATNYGTRLDATGLRVAPISDLHTANTYPFELIQTSTNKVFYTASKLSAVRTTIGGSIYASNNSFS